MGLDMYLYARRNMSDEGRARLLFLLDGVKRYDEESYFYLSRWSHTPEAERKLADQVIDLAGLTDMIGEESNHADVAYDGSYVNLVAVYWRKANAVHAWFVDNCQDGKDECEPSPVHPEQLAALHRTCKRALEAYRDGDMGAAEEALPPRSGFFFGGTDLDESWVYDVEYTMREIERVIHAAAQIGGGVEFVYQSSW